MTAACAHREKPALFNAAMVRAIRNDSKTQTRRPITNKWLRCLCLPDDIEDVIAQAPYQPGDVLWVRECFYVDTIPSGRLPDIPSQDDLENIYYRADGECCDLIPECSCAEVGKPRWRPAIHMKRWAARLFLEVTGVKVERIQDIDAYDAYCEGVNVGVPVGCDTSRVNFPDGFNSWPEHRRDEFFTAQARAIYFSQCHDAQMHIDGFHALWDKTYPGSWARNDWVFAYTLRPHQEAAA